MDSKLKRTTSSEDADLFKRVIHLTITIADKYKDERAYEAALEGLYVGLNLYSQKKRNSKLDLYLSWYIKTSIEYGLGIKNRDTKLWKTKKF